MMAFQVKRNGRKGRETAREEQSARGIVLIDQRPLRRSVAAECAAAMEHLDFIRAGWHRFDREDRPAFVRWRAREFGALLSEAREVELQIHDARALVHEVEMEMRRVFQSPQSAYQRVMFRRENPGAAEDEPAVSEPRLPGASPRLSEFEQEALFQEWVQKFLGTNPDKMDDEAYATTFEVFKSHMFRTPAEEKKKASAARQTASERPAENIPRANGDEEIAPASPTDGQDMKVDARVKELYRRLVRRLHPDLRADGSVEVSALWHEVQEAYEASDVARMEILLALCHIQADALGEETTLGQMRAVLHELQRSLRALEKSLREAEGEEAWNFARTGPNEDLRRRVERQLKFDLAGRSRHLDLLKRTIAEWKEGPVRDRQAHLAVKRRVVRV